MKSDSAILVVCGLLVEGGVVCSGARELRREATIHHTDVPPFRDLPLLISCTFCPCPA
jgi:hypothetical protein